MRFRIAGRRRRRFCNGRAWRRAARTHRRTTGTRSGKLPARRPTSLGDGTRSVGRPTRTGARRGNDDHPIGLVCDCFIGLKEFSGSRVGRAALLSPHLGRETRWLEHSA